MDKKRFIQDAINMAINIGLPIEFIKVIPDEEFGELEEAIINSLNEVVMYRYKVWVHKNIKEAIAESASENRAKVSHESKHLETARLKVFGELLAPEMDLIANGRLGEFGSLEVVLKGAVSEDDYIHYTSLQILEGFVKNFNPEL